MEFLKIIGIATGPVAAIVFICWHLLKKWIETKVDHEYAINRYSQVFQHSEEAITHDFKYNSKEWLCTVCKVTYEAWKTEAKECPGSEALK